MLVFDHLNSKVFQLYLMNCLNLLKNSIAIASQNTEGPRRYILNIQKLKPFLWFQITSVSKKSSVDQSELDVSTGV